MPPVVVLGWDALDAELLQDYRLEDQFGAAKRIATFCNPVIDEPHTLELWPSMITGQHPDEHGVHAVTDTDGVNWDSPIIDTLSTLSSGIIPQHIRTIIGERIRERGGDLDSKPARYYQRVDVPTLFDDGGRAISIPNYETGYDRRHGLDGVRNDVWGEIVPDRTVDDGVRPQVDLATVWETITREAGRRFGHTMTAVQEQHDVVWTWFGLLDTVGHIQPAMDVCLEQPAYQFAAAITDTVRRAVPDDAIVVSVSDHGLQDGTHTDYATLATGSASAHECIDDVVDVYDWVADNRSGRGSVESGYADGVGAMQEQLEALGYV